jgi:hypothetical protein
MSSAMSQNLHRMCLIPAILFVMTSCASTYAQSPCPYAINGSFQVGAGNYVRVPMGRFLLLRKDGHVGAIRILASRHSDDPLPRAHEWIGTVDYESYFSDDPNQFHSASRHFGQISFGRIKGFGFHYSWQSGAGKTIVGPWELRIDGQDSIIVGKYVDDKRYEFAPTSACSFDAIPNAADLQWFHYDRSTNHTILLSDLPGSR